jgi:D-beta-D-heptose 7-phosphate kinase / D-beta-D-heptose 1-phosphate adenosyltransferase
VTLDAEGAVLVGADGATHRTWADPAPPGHAVGAGDVFRAALTGARAVGADPPAAAELAQLAAAATVAGTGTCVCYRDDLVAAVGNRGSRTSIVDAAALATLVRRYRDRDACIVFTNGCFDVLHRGHVEYLEQARRLGDVLIVAMNSDASVRRLKGPERPINEAADRAAVLAALSCVDHVVVFEEDSPTALIELVRPDIYVKGGDYRPDLMPEAPLVRRLGGEVRSMTYVPDRSTATVIERIRARAPIPAGREARSAAR